MAINHDLSHHYHTICQHLVARFPDLKDAITLPGASINLCEYFIIIIYYMAIVNSVKIVLCDILMTGPAFLVMPTGIMNLLLPCDGK